VARFLTAAEKRQTIAAWLDARAAYPCVEGNLSGRGFPDADMLPWCDQLNAIEGVCTVQSCAGHGSAAAGSIDSAGHVWLLLDAAMSAAFDAGAFRLAADTTHIERVSRLYMPWGKEIASITFAGNERDLLNESMHVILTFFRSLRSEPPELEHDDGA
jgi:hypothetical protein